MSDFTAPHDGDAAAPTTVGEPTFDPPPSPFPPPPPLSRRRFPRWAVALVVVVALIVIAVAVLNNIGTEEYALAPGQAQPVTPFIKVPKADNHAVHGKILLTDVFLLGPLTEWQYIWDSMNSQEAVESAADVIGSAPESQYIASSYLDMAQSQSDATAAALTSLGYSVRAQNAGVLVYGLESGSAYPAAKVLKIGQVITKVNNAPTTSECQLLEALAPLAPGTKVDLDVEHSYLNDEGTFESGPVKPETVTLGQAPKSGPVTGCGAPISQKGILGITPEQQLDWNFPVKVSVHLADIGGPSAGLAMALGIIDKLSGGQLVGHKTIAATGAIEDPQGDIGDVGGVAQKTIAVERAGATVFFVPPQELAAAKSKDTKQLHVYAVSTLAQAIKILERLGGRIPANHQPAQAAP
ncbi:MAG TPA: S16 family serine protease [Acidimicrobiales bacterium]